ncbi:hypothetical protein [Corynebacterium gerontici]|uniref:Uncharacterized protein n=1 Tax=Corynebacterium gerontici TaxID=2079234 RepID=A0A3G6J2C5_9CORY|nr:hypothetical protein [Corynebacterium gerontici]AZA12177.1 hypothetical protein CGERO_09430 [Corynebacterium gerontici]
MVALSPTTRSNSVQGADSSARRPTLTSAVTTGTHYEASSLRASPSCFERATDPIVARNDPIPTLPLGAGQESGCFLLGGKGPKATSTQELLTNTYEVKDSKLITAQDQLAQAPKHRRCWICRVGSG